jgi:hypothetical protein
MKNLTKEIIENCVNSLMESTESGFSSGYVSDWAEWAKRMKSVINIITPQLESIANNLSSKETPSLHPSDKEVETWFTENVEEDCSASSAIYKFRLWLKDREISDLTK